MKKVNDSFLEMIGMNRSSSIVDEPTATTNGQSQPGALIQEFLEQEATERTVADEEQTESSEPATGSNEEFNFDEETHFAEEAPARTSSVAGGDDGEVQQLLSELQQDVTAEDRLLAGLEEAEASRATDIFAKSFRADSRKTRAHGKDESFIDFEDASTIKRKSAEPEDTLSKTVILQDEIEGLSASEIEEQTKLLEEEDLERKLFSDDAEDFLSQVQAEAAIDSATAEEISRPEDSDPSAEPSVEDPFLAIEDDGLYESFSANRGSGASRKTVAFEYSTGTDSSVEESTNFLLPLEGSPVEGPILLSRLPFSFGRDPKNSLSIPDDNNASRFHAEIRDVSGGLVVVDLNSTNGIQVNGNLVTEHALQPGDILQVGNLKVRFETPAASDATQAMLGSSEGGYETVLTPANKNTAPRRKKNTKKLAAIAAMVAVGFMGVQNFETIKKYLRGAVSGYVQNELADMTAEIATDLGKPIAEAEPEDVKTLAVAKLGELPLPDDYRAYLDQVPARLYQIILADPELSQALIANNGNITEVYGLLRTKMISAFNDKRNDEAAELVDMFLKETPDNAELLAMKKELKDRTTFVTFEKGRGVTDTEKDDFIRIMNEHNKSYEELVDAKNFESAKDYALKLLEKLTNLVRQRPYFEEFATSAISEWRGKVKKMEKSIEERAARRSKIRERDEKGDAMFLEVEKFLEQKKLHLALAKAAEFLAAFPDYRDAEEMLAIKEYLPGEMNRIVASAREKIEELTQREGFKQAWDLFYETSESVGIEFPSLQALKTDLEAKTSPRGAQFYNQARVFEFEADDIVAAEQFYKKTIDTVDPRGELADKASRRYEAVKRKNLQ